MLHSNYAQKVAPMGVTNNEYIAQNTNDATAPEEKIAKSIRIQGAVGTYAEHINSCFVQNGEMYNTRMLYQSLSVPYHWLWYTMTGKWMVSKTKDRDGNFLDGFCHCKASGLLDPSHARFWFVLGRQGRFRMQTRVIASNETDGESKPRDLQVSFALPPSGRHLALERELGLVFDTGECISTGGEQSTQDALPSVLKFAGVTGLLASKINGVYRCKTKKHPTNPGEFIEDKKIFYRYQSQSGWRYDSILLNDSQGRWMVLRDNQVLAYCELSGLADPCDAKRWHVSDCSKSLSSFTVQLSVDVTRGDVEEPHQKVRVRRKPSFHSPISRVRASSPKRAECVFVNTFSAPRWTTFSAGEPRKKTNTPYMKALKKLKSRNRNKKKTSNY